MKHVIILGDGMADWAVPSLGDKTLLQYAHTPYMDKLASMGRTGVLKTVADGFHPGSEVANMSVMGYDLPKVYEGRGVLEAASIGVDLQDGDMAMRCNIVCVEGETLKNHSAGHISTEEADELIRFLDEKLGSDRIHFYTGVQYRHLLVIKGGDKRLACVPPHDIPLQPFRPNLVKALCPEAQETADLLNALIKGAVITAVDLIRGIGRYAGLRCIDVEGATGLYNTNYEGKAQAAIEALKTDDFVYLHVEASDEAGHEGDVPLKLKTIEDLDSRIVGPVYEAVKQWDEPVAIAVLPDHPTPCELRTHTNEPIPFLIYYPGIEPDAVQTYDEISCKEGGYGLMEKDEFMNLFMNIQ